MGIEISDSSARALLALALSSDDSAATAIRTDHSIHYTPGSVVAGRFRITALAGRGGMGDVYRAEDLTLGQSVALKFLPGTGRADAAIMKRFHDEVRVGRQVAHPNVCRIYDLLEVDGRPAIVMEFVEGEDLATLLAREALPYATALQIARDVCAGVEAVHDKGVIHGDLKPSNVMIDGRGRARITDFGLSRLAEEKSEQHRLAGTIAYMAPEQFTTGAASVSSDLYSLGMVLYEIFTAQRARKESDPTKPEYAAIPPPISQRQPAIEPELERAIFRCLQPDPAQRPSSTRRVRSAFPPGDILDAVLAAGETPPAEFVAESRKVTPFQRAQVRVIAAGALVLLAVTVIASQRLTLYGRSQLPLSPAQLAARARTLLSRFSYVAPAVDEVSWFTTDLDSRSASSGLPSIDFEYRLSGAPLPASIDEHARNEVTPSRGAASVALSSSGGLLRLVAFVPDALAQRPRRTVSWDEVLTSAGFDPHAKSRATLWVPAVPYDETHEWAVDGSLVRASRFRGLLTSFEVIERSSGALRPRMRGSLLPDIVYFTIVLSSIGIGVFLARKNIRRRNVDVGAAWRVTLIVFACRAAYGLIAGHRSWSLEAEYRAITATLGTALLVAAQVGLAYVALEPYVRRRWPEAMIGWARLVRGRFRDPVVGRDLLVGVTAGLAIRLVDQIRNAAAPIANGRVIPSHLAVDALISLRETVGGLFAYVGRSIFFALFGFFVLVLLRKTVRSRAVAAAFWLVLATLAWIRWDDPVIEVVVVLTQMVILLWALQRFGLLAMTAAIFVHLVTVYTPLTADLHAFYFPQAATAVVALAALIVYASTAATVRQPAAPSSTQ